MNVADVHSVDGGIVNIDPGYFRRVFEETMARQPASTHIDIDLANLGTERAQRHVRNCVLRAGARERLFEVVGVPVDSGPAGAEDYQVSVEPGWVSVFGRVNIADVVGREVEIRQMQWRVHCVLNVDDVAIIDSETVDLKRVGSFKRVLPSPLPEWDFVLLFRDQLRLIDVDLRVRKEDVRHNASREKLLHLDVEAHHRDVGDRRTRMRLLNNLEPIQGENSANQL